MLVVFPFTPSDGILYYATRFMLVCYYPINRCVATGCYYYVLSYSQACVFIDVYQILYAVFIYLFYVSIV